MTEFVRKSTGIPGLDSILGGGFIEGRGYLLYGVAGAGKTILGFHFLQAGLDAGETALFINLEEEVGDLRANAASLGFEMEDVEILDLSPSADVFTEDQTYNVFEASEVEQAPLTSRIVERVEAVDPDRVVIDPVTQFRFLTGDDYQFRKQIVGLMRFLKRHDATVLFIGQETGEHSTEDLQFISDGTVRLSRTPAGRTLAVPKFRGSATQSGDHIYRITGTGIEVYPELQPGKGTVDFPHEAVPSGVPELDELLDGGLDRGTVTVLSGPTGVGKTTLGSQFMKEAAGRGERSVIYLFEETERTFLQRSGAVNIPVREMIERGTLRVEEIEAIDQSPQEFATRVRREVEDNDADIVMLDGTAGYRMALRGDEGAVTEHLHALGRYLKGQGVTTLFVDETRGSGDFLTATRDDISYLADNIVFLKHIELQGGLQKVIGVLKKRTGDFERTLRDFEITEHGITVGEPLTGLRGILSGSPEFVDD